MDKGNPLQFFTDLLETIRIKEEIDKPIEPNEEYKLVEPKEDKQIGHSPENIAEISEQLGGLSFDDISILDQSFDIPYNPNYWYSSYVNVNSDQIAHEKTVALQSIDNTLLEIADIGNVFKKLTVLVSTIDTVINKLTITNDIGLHPAVLSTCVELKTELQSRKKRLYQPIQTDNGKQPTPAKLQWVGRVNVLGTLFYHLLKGQDGGNAYISASVEQTKRMLMDNFVDSEGQELSKSTLDTIFTPGRSEKRANEGDRIELPNKKSKK